MKSRMSCLAAVVFVVGASGTWRWLEDRAVAGGGAPVLAAAAAAAGGDGEEVEFVGTGKCRMCHIKQHRAWTKGKHAQALETLKPGNASEVKEKFGLDPAKDYSTDESCLGCHTVGFGKPGGYAIPAAGDKKAEKRAKYTAGVGCESCHGAGSAFVDQHSEIMKSKREYTREEMYAGGMNKIEEATCKQCHNEKSPTIDPATYTFDYQQRLLDGVHEHFPLKQRKE